MRTSDATSSISPVAFLGASRTTLPPPGVVERDRVLVWATEPLRAVLVKLVEAFGYEVHAPATPLHAIETLIDAGHRFSHAVIAMGASDDLGSGMRDFLADEYPAIYCVTVDATYR
ncbi:MAG: hypothetical protein NT062_14120 [Proteobacteria bacterium]|nr:hypothetical protein [Pseudomonadota bacterium]